MGINPDFRDLFSELNAADARFLVVGAHAVIYYAVPRYTKDIDIWIESSPENARRVWDALVRFGAPVDSLQPDGGVALLSSGAMFLGLECTGDGSNFFGPSDEMLAGSNPVDCETSDVVVARLDSFNTRPTPHVSIPE